MLWTGPWDLSSINSDVDYGVTYLPGYNGNHETISGPDMYMLFDHSSEPQRHGMEVRHLADVGEGAPAVRDRRPVTCRCASPRRTLPGYATFLQKYPAEKVFVSNLDNVKHVRPNLPEYAQVSTAVGQMVQSVLLGSASPADALKSGASAVTAALAGS